MTGREFEDAVQGLINGVDIDIHSQRIVDEFLDLRSALRRIGDKIPTYQSDGRVDCYDGSANEAILDIVKEALK